MKGSRFSEEQIIGVLREHEAGAKTEEVCRRHGISSATFYKWKAKYGGVGEPPEQIGFGLSTGLLQAEIWPASTVQAVDERLDIITRTGTTSRPDKESLHTDTCTEWGWDWPP